MPTIAKSVLLVEDNWVIATELATTLGVAGYTVVGPAATLSEALTLAQTPIHFAVVDLNLSGERSDGLISDLCARSVKVVVVSGYYLPLTVEGNLIAFLQKPFGKHELLAALARGSSS
jgi:ActR/RegA family two-component response regulator